MFDIPSFFILNYPHIGFTMPKSTQAIMNVTMILNVCAVRNDHIRLRFSREMMSFSRVSSPTHTKARLKKSELNILATPGSTSLPLALRWNTSFT